MGIEPTSAAWEAAMMCSHRKRLSLRGISPRVYPLCSNWLFSGAKESLPTSVFARARNSPTYGA